MCFDPVSAAIAAAAIGGGTLLQQNARQDAENAREKAMAADRLRQDATRAKAREIFTSSLDRGAGLSDLTDATASREEFLSRGVKGFDAETDLLAGQKAAPGGLGRQAEKVFDATESRSRENAGLRANLESFGDLLTGNAIANTRANIGLGILGQDSKFSTDALMTRIGQIDRTGGQSPLGDILVALGTQAASGVPKTGAKPTGPTNIVPAGFKGA